MATSIKNGKGGVISVTSTPQRILVVPELPADGSHLSARYVKFNNVGASTAYVAINTQATDQSDGGSFYVESTAIPIGSLDDFLALGYGKPIKSFVIACATGETTTVNYGAF